MVDLANEKLLTVNDAARLLGVHSSTIFRWQLRGCGGHKLRMLKAGGARRIALSDLQDFIKRTTCAADGDPPQFSMRSPARRERDLRTAEQALADDGI
jgi:excisionase family DNA binding protein